jgi:hypothetical protein
VTEITRGPNHAYEPEQRQLGCTWPCFRLGIGGAACETAREIFLHQSELGEKVVCGSDGVELDEGDDVWVEGRDELECGVGAGGEEEDVVEQDAEEVLYVSMGRSPGHDVCRNCL